MNHLSSSRLLKPLVILQPQAGSAGVLRHGGRGMTALGREIEGSNPRCRKVRLASNKEVTGGDSDRGTYQTPQWKLPSPGTDVQRVPQEGRKNEWIGSVDLVCKELLKKKKKQKNTAIKGQGVC